MNILSYIFGREAEIGGIVKKDKINRPVLEYSGGLSLPCKSRSPHSTLVHL